MFIIQILISVIVLLRPLFYFLAYVISLPQILFAHVFNITKSIHIYNIGGVFFAFLFSFIYICLVLNLHILLYVYYFLEEKSLYTMIFTFTLLNSFYSFIYKFLKVDNLDLFSNIGSFFVHLSYFSFYFILIILYVLCLGNCMIYEYLIFKIPYNFIFIFQAIDICAKGILINILVACHCVNPISLLRVYYYIFYERREEKLKEIVNSFFLIIYDFLLFPMGLFNILFFKSFAKNSYEFAQFMYDPYKFNLESLSEYNDLYYKSCSFYIYLRFKYIQGPFISNIKILLAFVMLLINLFAIWRINKSIDIIKEYFNNNDFALLTINFALNIIDSILEMIYPFVYVYYKISQVNRRSYNKVKNVYMNCNNFDLNFYIFTQKKRDISCSILLLLRLLNITFIINLKNKYKLVEYSFS